MPEPKPSETKPPEAKAASAPAVDVCPICAESTNLALIKGCLRCLKCGFKWDCNGW
jgi:hypothetical protein